MGSMYPPLDGAAPAAPPAYVPVKPHRAGTVLALGILGFLACFICGIIAWVMGNKDLREMDMGIMDSSGRGTTATGRMFGIISVIWLLGWNVFLIYIGIFSALSEVFANF